MTSFALRPSLWKRASLWVSGQAQTDRKHQIRDQEHLIRKAERDLVNDMIWSCPEAFSSDLDVQYMMHMHRGRS